MSKELQGKNILITGSAKGIGRGIALDAASKGANIAVHYLGSEEEAKQTAEDISEYDVKATVVKADIAKISDVQQMKEMLDSAKLTGL